MAQIMVIDDEVATRRLVSFTLKSLGVTVEGAGDGTTALQLAAEHDFDLVLVDINLPDIDGFTLFQQLRTQLPEIPMLLFTARNNPDDEAYAQELGAAGFLYKPFSTQELRQLVTQHLDPG
jgi:two-component system, OmpR family, response regulator